MRELLGPLARDGSPATGLSGRRLPRARRRGGAHLVMRWARVYSFRGVAVDGGAMSAVLRKAAVAGTWYPGTA